MNRRPHVVFIVSLGFNPHFLVPKKRTMNKDANWYGLKNAVLVC
jgi:hypothetical protein